MGLAHGERNKVGEGHGEWEAGERGWEGETTGDGCGAGGKEVSGRVRGDWSRALSSRACISRSVGSLGGVAGAWKAPKPPPQPLVKEGEEGCGGEGSGDIPA